MGDFYKLAVLFKISCSFFLGYFTTPKIFHGVISFFFLEYAGDLRINILRRERGKEPPKCYRGKGSMSTLSGGTNSELTPLGDKTV